MSIDALVLKNDEKAIFKLRSLYGKYGYSQYKMSKFEEYDLYVKNKSFLVSDNIITFNDTDGKLMALKPDVTLSIVKNAKPDGGIFKAYYNENVYRVSKGTNSFKEIMQTGLECIGDIDSYHIYEVIRLAAESLKSISEDFVLDISHLGIVEDVFSAMGVDEDIKKDLIKCLGEKNAHGAEEICKSIDADCTNLKKLITNFGSPEAVLPVLKEISPAFSGEMEKIITLLEKEGYKGKINIDFSVVSDTSYYNGFVFKGYIASIATSVLSGGQYDNLMKKMGRKEKAIGFAVYLDEISRLGKSEYGYDVDTVILYDETTDIDEINEAVKLFTFNGKSVSLMKEKPGKIRYKQLVQIKERGVAIIENNA